MLLKIFAVLCISSLPIFSQASKSTQEKPVERLENKPVAVVMFVKGDVKVGQRRLKMGDRLVNGEIIKTGEKSSCDIQITSTQSPIVVRIKEKSSFQLNESKQGDESKFSTVIETGKAVFNVAKLSSKEKMEVVTPTQTCGIRGTKFEIGVSSQGLERTLVTEGKVATRARIAKLEELEASEQAVSEILQPLRQSEQQITAGGIVSLSKADAEEVLQTSGIAEILEGEEENPTQTLKQKLNDPKVKTALNNSIKQLASLKVEKLPPKTFEKKADAFQELIPVDPSMLERKGLLTEVLQQRNKEQNMISLIRKLKEENETLKAELEALKNKETLSPKK
ncbi:MAG: FecR domain-containing protein [Leptospiraceae bacterium]|nr:FecR domain-containing protein [Leptospiraceae bacterium]